jgi:pimeloyl-ACP methyl ester carboxylesterase
MTEILATYARGPAAGTPLVLLHAFPVDHEMWEPVAARLGDIPVLLVDAPGFGLSPVVSPTMAAAAGALWDTLDSLGIERAVLGGLSMGGYLAMAALALRPDRVAGLALADTKSTADDAAAIASRRAIAERVLAEGSIEAVLPMAESLLSAETAAERPELLREVRGWIARSEAAGVAWAQTAMAARPDSSDLLRSTTGLPAAVIVGELDALSPVLVAEELASMLVGATFTVVPRAGHLSAVEDPACVAAALRELMGRV